MISQCRAIHLGLLVPQSTDNFGHFKKSVSVPEQLYIEVLTGAFPQGTTSILAMYLEELKSE